MGVVVFKGLLPTGICHTVLNNRITVIVNYNMEGIFSDLF